MIYHKKIESYGEKIALVIGGEYFTYADLSERIKYFDMFCKDIDSGDVVALVSDYNLDSISLFLALAKKKCIIAPIVSNIESEISSRLSELKPKLVISFKNHLPVLEQYGDVQPETHTLLSNITETKHSGLILFSSGSTGKPKAMIHDLDNLINSYLDKRPKSLTIMVFLMFDHIGGLNTLLNSLSMGAKIVFPSKREADHIASIIEKEKVNLLPASPTFLNMLLMSDVNSRYNLKSLRMITYGTEAMPENLLLRIKKKFPRVKLLQTFGTSETGIAQTKSRSSSSLDIKIDDETQEYKIVNNELWLRSSTQILGYLNHSMDSFTDDGWFKTGDLVKQTEDGYLRVIGRLKELINVGGEKVLPTEVESVVLGVEGVVDCTAYSVPNSITGQSVAIDVVYDTELDHKLVKKQIRSTCLKNLDTYKVPTKINFIDKLSVSSRFKKKRN